MESSEILWLSICELVRSCQDLLQLLALCAAGIWISTSEAFAGGTFTSFVSMNLWIFISRPKKLTLHIDIYATKLTLSNRIQMSFFSQEMEWTVEWSGSKRREHGCEFNICSTWFSCEKIGWVSQFLYQRRFCVVVTLLPERVCHRLLWAIGDSLMPDGFLKCSQQSLQSRWRSHRFRCSDHILNPWGTFQTLLVLCTVLLVGCFQSADVLWQQIYKHGIRDPRNELKP